MGAPSPPPPPDPVDPGQAAESYIRAMADPELQELILSSESRFGPRYLENALGRQEASLFGIGDQQGLLEMSRRAAPIAEEMRAETARAQREADIADVEALGGRATAALRASDPLMGGLIDQQNLLTQDLYNRAQRLTPQQERLAVQGAREAAAARGREMDNFGLFGEVLGREEYLRANRAEAQQAGGNLFGMLQQTSADPFQAILGRPAQALPYSAATGQQALGFGSTQGTPNLFSPDAGVGLALQDSANRANYQASVYGAQAQSQGSLLGGLLGGAGSFMGGFF